jgi:hypothetical protein
METNYSKWRPIDRWEKIQTILYAVDQVMIAKSEDELQMAVSELNTII